MFSQSTVAADWKRAIKMIIIMVMMTMMVMVMTKMMITIMVMNKELSLCVFEIESGRKRAIRT